MSLSQSHPSSEGTDSLPTREAATTAAGDWIEARQAGARLAPHTLPDDTDVLIWTQAMEQRP